MMVSGFELWAFADLLDSSTRPLELIWIEYISSSPRYLYAKLANVCTIPMECTLPRPRCGAGVKSATSCCWQ